MPSDQEKGVFSPSKNYTGVVTEQGRVQLDSDSNEQGAIAGHEAPPKVAEVVAPGNKLPLVPASDK
jgi:Family of unknown function (DUF6519)